MTDYPSNYTEAGQHPFTPKDTFGEGGTCDVCGTHTTEHKETYEDQAREIGTEHGRNAASWVELDEETAEQIDRTGDVLTTVDPSSPLSGEWADGYTIDGLLDDVGFPEAHRVEAGGGIEADITDAYEDAYWQAFEYGVERKVEAMRGPVPTLDTSARYTVDGWPAVAVYVDRFTFGGRVVVVMVGDDREHVVDPEDLTRIEDDAYCWSCGQVGCYGDGRGDA